MSPMRRLGPRWPLWVAPAILVAGASLAHAPRAAAIDTLRKRVTVDFGDVPCMTRVDRSVDPLVPLSWTIEQEELYPIPADEVPGGRTHQLLALAQQGPAALPTWVSQADVDASAAVVPDFGEPADTDVFERSPDWPTGSWARVTPDDPRIPITFEAAAQGATWDTTGLPTGPYQLIGYTYDPPVNVTSRREGLFRVVDGDAPAPPGLFIEPIDIAVTTEGTTLDLEACVDADSEITLRAYIGEVLAGAAAPTWEEVDLELDAPPTSGSFGFGVEIPFGAGGEPLRTYRVRLDIEDADGRRYAAYSPRVYNIKSDPDGPPPSGDGGSGGCRVDSSGPSGSGAALALLGLMGLRRRRVWPLQARR